MLELPRPTLCFLAVLALGCDREYHGPTEQHGIPDATAQTPSRALQWPVEPPPKPAAPPTAERRPDPSTDTDPAEDPAMAKKKAALADVGKSAFEALRSGDFKTFLGLTNRDGGTLAADCPDLPSDPREELQARFDHCNEAIAWDEIAEAQVFAGESLGEPAPGCSDAYEDYGRLRLFLHMNDETIWNVDFLGAVGRDGQAVGINGAVTCREVDEAPEL